MLAAAGDTHSILNEKHAWLSTCHPTCNSQGLSSSRPSFLARLLVKKKNKTETENSRLTRDLARNDLGVLRYKGSLFKPQRERDVCLRMCVRDTPLTKAVSRAGGSPRGASRPPQCPNERKKPYERLLVWYYLRTCSKSAAHLPNLTLHFDKGNIPV